MRCCLKSRGGVQDRPSHIFGIRTKCGYMFRASLWPFPEEKLSLSSFKSRWESNLPLFVNEAWFSTFIQYFLELTCLIITDIWSSKNTSIWFRVLTTLRTCVFPTLGFKSFREAISDKNEIGSSYVANDKKWSKVRLNSTFRFLTSSSSNIGEFGK
jgi:hypothetical protein